MPCILAMFDFDQCYPKRCSGRKLCRLRFIRQQKIGQRLPRILLTPTATSSTLSPSDSKTILPRGLAVVDCSWNQLDKTAFHRAKVFFNFFGIFIRSFDFPGSLGMLFTRILWRFFPGT